MNRALLVDSLVEHEGWRNTAYKDPLGILTVGVGHNLERPISDAAVKQILSDDIDAHIEEMDRLFPSWADHSDARQNVLLEMCINMGGPRLKGFVRMWEALSANDYTKAAYEMLNSQWAVQVGRRAKTLSVRMRDDK